MQPSIIRVRPKLVNSIPEATHVGNWNGTSQYKIIPKSVSNKQMYAVSNIQIDSMSIINTLQPNKYQRIEKNSEYLLGPAQEQLILQSKDCAATKINHLFASKPIF